MVSKKEKKKNLWNASNVQTSKKLIHSSIYQGDQAITEIQFKYEKLKFCDLFNESMELVFQKIKKWDI